MFRLVAASIVLLIVAAAPASDIDPTLKQVLEHDLNLTSADIAALEAGRSVTRDLAATALGEIGTVGAVRVHARKDLLTQRYRDIRHFKTGSGVLQIGTFSNPPRLDDLAGLTITHDDLNLRGCRVGDCDVRLPAGSIERVRREINWRAPDADARAALLFKQLLVDDVRAYVSGGTGGITEYDDGERPIRPVDEFQGLLTNSPYVGFFLPGLAAHLRTLPLQTLPDVEDFLYWSKEEFGLTPFITVTHVMLAPSGPQQELIASRDVYSSRYIDASLTLTIASDSVRSADAFYLVYVNRSRVNALKGAFGRLRRAIVARRVRGSVEKHLEQVKGLLERIRS